MAEPKKQGSQVTRELAHRVAEQGNRGGPTAGPESKTSTRK